MKEDDGLPSKPPPDSNTEKLSVSEKEKASSMQEMESDSTSRIALILEDTPPDDESEKVPAARPSLGPASAKSAATPLPVPRSSDDSGADLTDTPQVRSYSQWLVQQPPPIVVQISSTRRKSKMLAECSRRLDDSCIPRSGTTLKTTPTR